MTNASTDSLLPGLTGMMVVHNEADRYLRETLTDLLGYCERVVVLDDGSTDKTPALLAEMAAEGPHAGRLEVMRHEKSTFWENESQLRQKLWNHVTSTHRPKWVACVDADEMLERKWRAWAGETLARAEQEGVGLITFNLVELWGDRDHYRVDGYWNPKGRYSPVIMRYREGYEYRWNPNPLHCGRFPLNPPGPVWSLALRLKHLGYANPAEHRLKYERYIAADPAGRYSPLSHYQSIILPAVREEWRE